VSVVLSFHLISSLRAEKNSNGIARTLAMLWILVIGSGGLYGLSSLIDSTLLAQRFGELFEGGDASMRLFLFGSAIDLFLTDMGTVLFGAGINSFPVAIGRSGAGWYPHNIVLELLAEYGLVGCLLFFLPFGYVIWTRHGAARRAAGKDREEWTIVLVAIYFFMIACISGDVSSSWVLLFFTVLILPSTADADSRVPQPVFLKARIQS